MKRTPPPPPPGAAAPRPSSSVVPVRWPRSQKLIGYYNAHTGELVYQDARGQILDRIDLTVYRRAGEPQS